MQGFSRLRFEAYAKDLEQAILGLSREQMPPHGWPIRRKPEEPKPIMNDAANVTPLPTIEIIQAEPVKSQVPIQTEALQPSITGAGFLGSQISDLINAIKSEVNSTFEEIQGSATELRASINAAKGVSKALKSESQQIKSQLGAFTNFPPEGEE